MGDKDSEKFKDKMSFEEFFNFMNSKVRYEFMYIVVANEYGLPLYTWPEKRIKQRSNLVANMLSAYSTLKEKINTKDWEKLSDDLKRKYQKGIRDFEKDFEKNIRIPRHLFGIGVEKKAFLSDNAKLIVGVGLREKQVNKYFELAEDTKDVLKNFAEKLAHQIWRHHKNTLKDFKGDIESIREEISGNILNYIGTAKKRTHGEIRYFQLR